MEAQMWDEKLPQQPVNPRFLKIGIIGEPNAGKSTLINRLVGMKISAVSTKTHTTRNNILGVVTSGETQLCFLDTPGITFANSKTIKTLFSEAQDAIAESDLVMVIVDCVKTIPGNINLRKVIKSIENLNAMQEPAPSILVLNKMDLYDQIEEKAKVDVLSRFKLHFPNIDDIFQQIFTISALNGKGVIDLQKWLETKAKPGLWEFHHSTKTPRSDLEITEEIIREKLFRRLNQEVPYLTRIETTGWGILPDGTLGVSINVIVPKESMKSAVYGQKGSGIYSITNTAQEDLMAHFQRKVLLRIHVKVSKYYNQMEED